MKTALLKRYFIAGILLLAPLWVTFTVIEYLVYKFDRIMSLLPDQYQPDTLLGFHVPGLGLIAVGLLILLAGLLATNFVGTYFVNLWERFLARIPLVRSIYAGVKQILNTVFSPGGKSFRKVVLIEYPRRGLWALAFQTGTGLAEVKNYTNEDMVTVFVPTTPNPTGGYLLFLSAKDVIELKISVDEALKLIISLGVILPKEGAITTLDVDVGHLKA